MKLPDYNSLDLTVIYESSHYFGVILPRPIVEVVSGQFVMSYLVINKKFSRIELFCPTELQMIGTIRQFESAWEEFDGIEDQMSGIMNQIKGNPDGNTVH